MAINSLSGYRPRISGISSGMDTETMVVNLMKVQQLKLDKVYKERTKMEWKRDGYNDSIKLTRDFRQKYMSVLSKDNMFSSSVYQTGKANIPSNSYVDVIAKSSSSKTNYEILRTKLATAAQSLGNTGMSRYAGIEGATGTNMEAVTTGTKEFSVNAASQELKDLTFSDGTKAFTFTTADDKLSFSINGKDFVFEQNQTMQDVINTVNADADANVTMSFDGNKIKFRSDSVGAGAALNFGNVGTENAVFGSGGAFGIEKLSIEKTNAMNTGMTFAQFEAATGKSFGFTSGSNSITINGTTFAYDKNDTIDSFMQKINDASGTTGVKMYYNDTNDSFHLRSSRSGNVITAQDAQGTFFGAASGIEAGTTSGIIGMRTSDSIFTAAKKMNIDLQTDNGMLKFSINGEEFSFDIKNTTISQMTSAINNSTKANAEITYSSISDSFTLRSRSTGESSQLDMQNGTNSNVFGAGGLFGMAMPTTPLKGTNAELEISDGRETQTLTSASNKFSLDGMDVIIKGNMAPGTDSIKFNITQDSKEVVEKVKNFITEYNSMIKTLTSKINEAKNYKYPPLSEEERDALSEKDLEAWESKAKQGVLKNDTDITRLMSDLRGRLNVKIGDTGLSASNIGITMGTSVYSAENEIVFDEEKFKAALEKNPDAVAQVMVATSDDKSTSLSPDGINRTAKTGWMAFISETTNMFEKKVSNQALKNTNKNIEDTDEKMDEMVKKMYVMEERYYAEYARMEKLLSQYQAQGNWLTAQLG